MIWTVLSVNLRRLRHNRVELMLTFVVPIAFFSIFAMIFGGGVGSTPSVKVVGVDTIGSAQSQRTLRALHQTPGLRFVRGGDDEATDAATMETSDSLREALTVPQAEQLVRRGTAAMAIILREESGRLAADLLSDRSDQVAPQVVAALVQQAILGESVPASGGESRSTSTVDLSQPPRNAAMETASRAGEVAQAGGLEPFRTLSPVVPPSIRVVDILGHDKANPIVSLYAAGIAVMFLLFGATGGGGALLEERENETLDRLLTTGLTMDQLLLGKWFYLTLLGVVQTTVMFIWGQFVFGIDLWRHFDGFLIMTLVTAGAAAAFGLLLATLCKTRGQLNGLSVVVVLTMSALGGSMVPRYLMSEPLQRAGLWTFNAWALDGYDKVFWRGLPVADLWPQMSVLMLSGATFLVMARLLAIRWETQ